MMAFCPEHPKRDDEHPHPPPMRSPPPPPPPHPPPSHMWGPPPPPGHFPILHIYIYNSPFSQRGLSNVSSFKKYPCPGTELFRLLVTSRYSLSAQGCRKTDFLVGRPKNAEIYPRGAGESSIRRHTVTLTLCASSS